MDINVSIDIVYYTLCFFWALCLFCLLAVIFVYFFWDILFPEYDQMPEMLEGEDHE